MNEKIVIDYCTNLEWFTKPTLIHISKMSHELLFWLEVKFNWELPIPSIGTNKDRFLFCWDNQEHHLEVELGQIEEFEWFYRNRKSGIIDSFDTNKFELNENFLKYLNYFV